MGWGTRDQCQPRARTEWAVWGLGVRFASFLRDEMAVRVVVPAPAMTFLIDLDLRNRRYMAICISVSRQKTTKSTARTERVGADAEVG